MVERYSRFQLYPSDRELILRSKINLGWSVHSHRVYRRLETLSDSELDFILGVISRAQEIDLFEQRRIGRLVERLENIKHNTLENGPKSCSMCGMVFGMLSLSIFKCYDCAKSVCNKCRVDTHSVAHDPCMLCKLCAEDRELWKKSGGWFYGSLPSYTKPTRKAPVSPSTGRTTWEHRKPEIVRLESFEPAENENQVRAFNLRSSWASLPIQKEGDSDNDRDSLDDSENSLFNGSSSGFLKPMEDNFRREASFQHLAAPEMNLNLLHMSSLSTSCPALVPQQMRKNIYSHQSIGTLEFSLAYNSKSNVLQCTVYSVKELAARIKDNEMTYVKIFTIPFSKKINTVRTKSVSKDTTVEFNETLVFSKIRQEKLKKRILRLQVLDEDPFDEKVIGEVGVDLSDLKSVESKFFNQALKEGHSEMQNVANCGWILLSLRYSPEDHALFLGINCCSDLVASNKNGQLNSFVRVKLLPDLSEVKYDSAVKHKTLNPTFNEFLENTSAINARTISASAINAKTISASAINARTISASAINATTISTSTVNGRLYKYGCFKTACFGMGKTDWKCVPPDWECVPPDFSKNRYVTLGIQARGETLQHWLEALQKPKISVEKWHALSKETKYFV